VGAIPLGLPCCGSLGTFRAQSSDRPDLRYAINCTRLGRDKGRLSEVSAWTWRRGRKKGYALAVSFEAVNIRISDGRLGAACFRQRYCNARQSPCRHCQKPPRSIFLYLLGILRPTEALVSPSRLAEGCCDRLWPARDPLTHHRLALVYFPRL
jgi:hypothetical protein